MQQDLMQQGVSLMLYGMGTVFVFLVVLIGVTTSMSYILRRFFAPEAIPVTPRTIDGANPVNNDDEVVAVITAAIHKFRSRSK